MSGPDDPSNPAGMEMRPAHFPGRAPLDAYGEGGFRFAGMSHRGSLLCLPSGIYAWSIEEVGQLTLDAFDRVLAEAAQIEVLLVGTGPEIVPLKPDWRVVFRNHAISADAMSTGSSCVGGVQFKRG